MSLQLNQSLYRVLRSLEGASHIEMAVGRAEPCQHLTVQDGPRPGRLACLEGGGGGNRLLLLIADYEERGIVVWDIANASVFGSP